MMSVPSIAIVGGGPAGLTLARLLYKSLIKPGSTPSISLTLFEADASPSAREGQGGTLDLHTDTGLAAVRACGLWDAFAEQARYEGQEMIMADKNGTYFAHLRAERREGRPEIDRTKLRDMLLASVPSEFVQWDHKLKSITAEGELNFKVDGREATHGPFDLVVGADGAWSKVRARLTDNKPHYAGVSGFELEIHEPAKKCPDLEKMVGRGSFFGLSDRRSLNAQRMGNDSLKIRNWFICAEGEAEALLESKGKAGILAELQRLHATWAHDMTALLRFSEVDTLRHWTLYELPVGTAWRHTKGYTLVGDAASLATPFSGEGVNKAMADAMDLAGLIQRVIDPASISTSESIPLSNTKNTKADTQVVDKPTTLDDAVSAYESIMFPRAHEIQARTRTNKEAMFGADAPVGLFGPMIRTMTGSNPSIFARIARTEPVLKLVYAVFWLWAQVGWGRRLLREWRTKEKQT